jgi:hypothetical protein
MIKHLLALLIVSAVGFAAFTTKAEGTTTNTLSSSRIVGAQLSIALSTNTISAGSWVGVFATLKNSSTNVVYIGETSPATDFLVVLTDSVGKERFLTDIHPRTLHRNLRSQIGPGESRRWIIPVAIGKGIQAGEYSLEAKRKIAASGETFVIESNILRIRIQ